MANVASIKQKTHFRKAFNSPYLSSADITEPTVLTVSRVSLEGDKSKKVKDLFNTAYFSESDLRPGEKLKPMILNATNSKMMYTITGSHFIEDWLNVRVTVYVQSGIKNRGELVDGLRLMPAPERKQLTPQNKSMWDNAISAFRKNGNFDAILKRVDISEANKALLIEAAKQ